MSDKARTLFDALDLDRDGTLTRTEVILALQAKGPTLAAQGVIPLWGVGNADDASALFDEADLNGDRVLSFEEFAGLVNRRFGW
ncbi:MULTISPECIES: EF-hand domain-containing protein [unclassified Streptomyces]|uniref:EF-hand domain-containing protein n=1 Tax=unclassified Streptomyces TaxID=2593676 RepID=UPI002FCC581D